MLGYADLRFDKLSMTLKKRGITFQAQPGCDSGHRRGLTVQPGLLLRRIPHSPYVFSYDILRFQ